MRNLQATYNRDLNFLAVMVGVGLAVTIFILVYIIFRQQKMIVEMG